MKKFLLVMGVSAGVFVVSALAHNAVSAWFDIEEAVFFSIAIFLAPAAFLMGVVGSIDVAIKKFRMGR